MNEFIYNAVIAAVGKINKLKVAGKYEASDCVIVGDEHDISYFLCGALAQISQKKQNINVHIVRTAKTRNGKILRTFMDQWDGIKVWDSLEEYFERKDDRQNKEIFFDIANLRDEEYLNSEKKEQKLNEIRKILEHNVTADDSMFQLITCIPDIKKPLPEVTHAVAEREYEVVYADCAPDSLEKYVIRLEDLVREYMKRVKFAQVIRLDRVFGPGIETDDNIWINDIIDTVIKEKKIVVYEKDRHDFASAVYVKDAVTQILLAAVSGRNGNIYHVSSWELSRAQIVSCIYQSFPELEISLEQASDKWENDIPVVYRMLNARKIRLAHRTKLDKILYTTKNDAIKSTVMYFLGVTDYIPKSDVNVYYGRMNRIREVELEILKEVDAICKKNNIQYFLTAGTMLGAVRHNEFIPWDDDVDIGMLPEDYEKFLKVCPESLRVDYGYQSYSTELTSHYIHDKIRLRNSFFSTKYSDKYPMMNGVYIDVFIYHKTSDKPRKQKRHIRQIHIMRKIIGIRWADKPRKNMHYYFSKVALPIMRLFPFMTLHKIYTRILNKYERKNTHYRIDGTGFNLKKVGAFPDEWFHGTVEHEFCGYKFPIPAHYDDILSHWYSDRYMELLPISGRKSVHDVVRIDLGQNLFDETMHDDRFRDVDLRGELFEEYK